MIDIDIYKDDTQCGLAALLAASLRASTLMNVDHVVNVSYRAPVLFPAMSQCRPHGSSHAEREVKYTAAFQFWKPARDLTWNGALI